MSVVTRVLWQKRLGLARRGRRRRLPEERVEERRSDEVPVVEVLPPAKVVVELAVLLRDVGERMVLALGVPGALLGAGPVRPRRELATEMRRQMETEGFRGSLLRACALPAIGVERRG